jgi:hypothetical protein
VKSFSVRIFRNLAIDVFDRNGAKVHPACRYALSEVLRCKGCLWREAGMVL